MSEWTFIAGRPAGYDTLIQPTQLRTIQWRVEDRLLLVEHLDRHATADARPGRWSGSGEAHGHEWVVSSALGGVIIQRTYPTRVEEFLFIPLDEVGSLCTLLRQASAPPPSRSWDASGEAPPLTDRLFGRRAT